MLNNRRRFIRAAGVIAGLSAFSAFPAGAVAQTEVARGEGDVVALIARYATNIAVKRSAGSVEFTVRSRGHREFAKAFNPHAGLPFERIRVGEGDTLDFHHRGTRFTIIPLI